MAPIFVMLIKALLPTAVEYIKNEVVEALDEQEATRTKTKESARGSKVIRNRKAATS